MPDATLQPALWAKLVSNSNWNFAAFAAGVFANFLTLPYVVHRIGMAQFGSGGLILAVLAPLMLVGTVIGQACVRELAPMMAEQRFDAARVTFSTALALCLGGCLAVFLVFGLGGSLLMSRLMSAQTAAMPDLKAICLVAVAGWVAQQFFQVVQAAISATQQYRVLATLNGVSATTSALCLLLATWVAPTLLGFLGGTALGFGLTLLLSAIQLRRHVAAMFPLVRPRRADLWRILAFSRWQGSAQLAGAMALQTDRYLLGATAAMSTVGQFNVAIRLQEVVYMGVLKISEVLFPHFSASAAKPVEHQVPVFMASSWLINAIAAAALAPLIPLSGALITLWVGPDAAQAGAPMLRTLVTAGIVGSGMNVFTYFALGNGYTKHLGVMALVHSVTVAVCSTALILTWGPLAAGAGFLVANVMRLAWAIAVTPRLLGGAVRMAGVAKSTLPPIAAGLLIGWAPWPAAVVAVASWPGLAIGYASIVATVLLTAVLLSSLGAQSRALILRIGQGVRDHFLKR